MRIKETVERLQLEADRAREEIARLRDEVEELKRLTAAGTGAEKPTQAADGAAKTVRKRTAKKTAEAAEE